MNCRDLRSELVQLMEKQVDTLEKQTFGGIDEAEQREYDERQKLIHVLCDELNYLNPAA
jgi:hypothetical protein